MKLRQNLHWVETGLRRTQAFLRQGADRVLTQKYLSDLELRDGPVPGADGDYAVLLDDDTFSGKDPFCRTEQSPYVVHLSNCALYPAHRLHAPGDLARLSAIRRAGQEKERERVGRFVHKPGNLIVTHDNELTCGSLTRDSELPPLVRPGGPPGTWKARLPRVVDRIDEPVVFIDLLCAHFGHALIDTPARLWYRLEPSLEHLRDLPMVGFGTHRLGSKFGLQKPSAWPSYLTLILDALGIDPGRITLLTKPTRCRSVFIPKRLSPYWSNYGYSRRYLDTMQAAGDALAGGAEPRGSHRLVYLSRSKLDATRRGLLDGQELAVEDIFRAQGFEVVHPQLLSLPEQIRIVRGATHVAGCVGSQMHLMAFARNEGKRVLRIAPSYFDTPTDRNIVRKGGGNFASFVVDRERPLGVLRSRSAWNLTKDDLSRLQIKLDQWLDKSPNGNAELE